MKNLRIVVLVCLAVLSSLAANSYAEPLFQQKDLFISGLDGVNIYRIPSLLTTSSGVILAFCEAREGDDCSPTDLVLKRSLRARKTLIRNDGVNMNGVVWAKDRKWQPMQVVLPGKGEAIMNPCPVIDRSNGTIWLGCAKVIGGLEKHMKGIGETRTLILKSTDDGKTWSKPVDITASVGVFVPGPGVGIQLQSGRLVIPGYDSRKGAYSAVIYSDDNGRSWQAGDKMVKQTNESQVVQLSGGTIMLNMRSSKYRDVAISGDGGKSWGDLITDKTLIDSWGCQSSLLYYTRQSDGFAKDRILFANPAHESNRFNMTVRLSYDNAKTWPVSKTVYTGPAAYSSLTVLEDGTIGLLYETGADHPYQKIAFARFNLEWLTGGRDVPKKKVKPAN